MSTRYVIYVEKTDSHGDYFERQGPAYKESTARRKLHEMDCKAYITKYGNNTLVDANWDLNTPYGSF